MDDRNCGAIGTSCSSTTFCIGALYSGGVATPSCGTPVSNDTLANATSISMVTPSTVYNTGTFTFDLSHATGQAGVQCAAVGPEVYYRIDVGAPIILYADTFGTTFDTVLYVADAMGRYLSPPAGTSFVACNDDSCSGNQSQLYMPLNSGRYWLGVGAYTSVAVSTGTLHVQQFVTGSAGFSPSPLVAGTATVTAPAMSGMGNISVATTGTDPGCSPGANPEFMTWFNACPTYAGGSFSATTCGLTGADTYLVQVSPARGATAIVRNNNGCSSPQATLASAGITIPSGAGFHALYLDTCGTTSTTGYSASVTRP
jgi:hypothetical protein